MTSKTASQAAGKTASRTASKADSDAASLLKVLGEPTRLEIVRRLAVEDLCTCHLVDDLGIAQSLVSHHLGILRQAGILRAEPSGAFTYYMLERPALAEVAELLGGLARQPSRPRRRPCA
jgi:ArsR family transcriptional regulator, arsenate/arsenite/antimonite-responsive transcriptional repressor